MKISIIIIIAIVMTVKVNSVQSCEMTKFSILYGRVHLHDNYISSTPIESQTRRACATLCFNDNTCSLVEYSSATKYCTLFFWKTIEMLMVPNFNTYMDTVVMVKQGNKRKSKYEM